MVSTATWTQPSFGRFVSRTSHPMRRLTSAAPMRANPSGMTESRPEAAFCWLRASRTVTLVQAMKTDGVTAQARS